MHSDFPSGAMHGLVGSSRQVVAGAMARWDRLDAEAPLILHAREGALPRSDSNPAIRMGHIKSFRTLHLAVLMGALK
jgi:hypothetical protein